LAPGVVPALYELVEYICKPDEKALITTPSYIYFKLAADYNQIQLVCSDLNCEDGYYGINFADFEKKAQDPQVTLCIFCNPHNPTGRIWTEDELRRVAEICFANNVLLISDEIHCDLIRIGKKHIPLAKLYPDSDQIITCMAPSKTFNMAGFLISNIIIPNEKVRKVWKDRHYLNENPLSIAAAQAAYEYGYDWLAELKLYLDANFEFVGKYLKQHLPKAKYRISEATYLGWINIGEYVDKDVNLPLFFANNAGVLLEGGNMFVANSDCCIRLNLACPRSVMEEGLRRICELLNKNRYPL
jgi:cystathionine beta-lyase